MAGRSEGPSSLEQYEQRLYAAWSAFEGGSGGLTRTAALALCDALQLGHRGAQLVDELFARTDAVSFSQFRGGLLAVLGATGDANAVSRTSPQPPHSDDSSSGRELPPRLTVGAKRYGRRSRPARPVPAPAPSPEGAALRHDAPVDVPRALELCRELRMEGVDRALVESIFEATPSAGTTVGEFFDRLNAELGSMAGATGDETLPADAVLEAWEHGGVQRPRRLLLELGFAGPTVPALALEAALDRELDALNEPEARALVLQAALSLSRMRTARALHAAHAATEERARLAQDVAEGERRARRVAAEADEQQARLEGELRVAARRADQRLADAIRQGEEEVASERERAQTERAELQAEAARRAEAEGKLRGEMSACTERAEALEARCAAAEERVAGLERERARLVERCAAAASEVAPALAVPDAALEAALLQLRADNLQLRDRVDELQAQLDAPPTPPRTAAVAPATPLSAEAASLDTLDCIEECDSLPGAGQPSASPSAHADAVAAALDAADTKHAAEQEKLTEVIRTLEGALEAMREEYERCEEYWEGKLRDERAVQAAEQRATDDRLAALLARVQEYEQKFTRALPAIPEAAEDLEHELVTLKQQHAHDLAAKDEELRRREHQLRQARHRLRLALSAAETAGACGGVTGDAATCGALRLRLHRAEECVTRLMGRLAAADLLVKQLYVENCLLTPTR